MCLQLCKSADMIIMLKWLPSPIQTQHLWMELPCDTNGYLKKWISQTQFLKSRKSHKIRSQPKSPESWNREKSIYISLGVDFSAKIDKNSKNRRPKIFKIFPEVWDIHSFRMVFPMEPLLFDLQSTFVHMLDWFSRLSSQLGNHSGRKLEVDVGVSMGP